MIGCFLSEQNSAIYFVRTSGGLALHRMVEWSTGKAFPWLEYLLLTWWVDFSSHNPTANEKPQRTSDGGPVSMEALRDLPVFAQIVPLGSIFSARAWCLLWQTRLISCHRSSPNNTLKQSNSWRDPRHSIWSYWHRCRHRMLSTSGFLLSTFKMNHQGERWEKVMRMSNSRTWKNRIKLVRNPTSSYNRIPRHRSRSALIRWFSPLLHRTRQCWTELIRWERWLERVVGLSAGERRNNLNQSKDKLTTSMRSRRPWK